MTYSSLLLFLFFGTSSLFAQQLSSDYSTSLGLITLIEERPSAVLDKPAAPLSVSLSLGFEPSPLAAQQLMAIEQPAVFEKKDAPTFSSATLFSNAYTYKQTGTTKGAQARYGVDTRLSLSEAILRGFLQGVSFDYMR